MKEAYKKITDAIIEMIEKNKILPWEVDWTTYQAVNLKSKKPYRGINSVTTRLAIFCYKFKSSYFITKKQAETLGGSLKPNAKAFPILFYKSDFNVTTGEKEVFAIWYEVYNLDHVKGIKAPVLKKFEHDPIKKCEEVIKKAPKPKIYFENRNVACYNWRTDKIHMIQKENFTKVENYYATLFHELSHSTGHKSRLNRQKKNDWELSTLYTYSKEELIAELGAAFLCGHCGLKRKTIGRSASYLKNWLDAIKASPKMLIEAGGAAQKSTDYLLRIKKEVKKTKGKKMKKKLNFTVNTLAKGWQVTLEEKAGYFSTNVDTLQEFLSIMANILEDKWSPDVNEMKKRKFADMSNAGVKAAETRRANAKKAKKK